MRRYLRGLVFQLNIVEARNVSLGVSSRVPHRGIVESERSLGGRKPTVRSTGVTLPRYARHAQSALARTKLTSRLKKPIWFFHVIPILQDYSFFILLLLLLLLCFSRRNSCHPQVQDVTYSRCASGIMLHFISGTVL